MGIHKHNFSLDMNDWAIFHDNKRCSIQKTKICVKLIHFIKINSFFFKCLVKFLRNNIKYAVSSTVSGALLGELKVFTFESCDYSRRITSNKCKNEYPVLKLIGKTEYVLYK